MHDEGGRTGKDPTTIYNEKYEPNGRTIPRIVHVSNFRPVKDAQSMARIFLGIRQQMEAELWLIGEGPEMEGVVSILQQGQVESDVRYWGLRHDVAPLLAQTDLLLMTSLSESFCLAALEAMACGIPVLATRVGGVPEVVIHGETGFLFPVGDHDVAVRTAVNLLSNPTQHQAMGVRAGQHASRFDHNKIVPAYENLYQRLLYRKSSRSPHAIAWATQSL
jgi:N-acetyl-alpha-D-glucosaminyl L-malate synthase BshA